MDEPGEADPTPPAQDPSGGLPPTAPNPPPAPAGSSPRSGEDGEDRPAKGRRKGARPARNAQYWMIVSSPDNFRKTRDHGFTAQGIKSRHRRRVETMRQGDRVLYYVAGRMAFAATATVTSPMYEDHTPIWRTARREEDYPWRVRMRPDSVLEELDWISAKDVAYRLEYVRKWPPEHWTLAFQGHLHQLAQKDFKLIEDEIRRTRRSRSGVS